MSVTACPAGPTAGGVISQRWAIGVPAEPSQLRLALGSLVGLLLATTLWADNPSELYFDGDPASVASGGLRMPGELVGRAEVERPASLAEADRPFVRLGFSHQAPLRYTRAGETVTQWTTRSLATECVVPLGPARRASGFTVGVRHEQRWETIGDDRADKGWAFNGSQQGTEVAGAYTTHSGWVAGLGVGRGSLDAPIAGDEIRRMLALDPSVPTWPRFSFDSVRVTAALRQRSDRWSWGVQYATDIADSSLSVRRGDLQYRAPMDLEARRISAFGGLHRRNETWFATAATYNLHLDGSVLVGVLSRGDLDVDVEDQAVAVGWRRDSGERVSHLSADWRHWAADGYAQGYAGLAPGLLSPVYTLRGCGDVSTVSLRYGSQRPLRPHWALMGGAALHWTDVDGFWVARRVPGLVRDPQTISQDTYADGIFRAMSLGLGVAYHTDRWTVALSSHAAYGLYEDHLPDDPPQPPRPPPPRPPRTSRGDGVERRPLKPVRPEPEFRPLPTASLSVEYRF